jgi:hypothetical protein
MANNSLKILDPVAGLVDFVLDIKPFHTKIVEVLIEYVYNEFIDVIIVDDIKTTIDLTYPNTDTISLACDGGYSTRPYGDYGKYPIISPNPAISSELYPAINVISNSFTIPGNRSGDLKPGTKVFLISTIEDYSNTHRIEDVKAGPANIVDPPSFTVLGDQTLQFILGYVFDVVGSPNNDRTYSVVLASTYDVVTNRTTIPVGQSIQIDVPYGLIGVVKTNHPGNTGEYTVNTSTYDPGFIDSWPNINDSSTFVLGNDPHTIVTVVEPLSVLPTLGVDDVYVSFMTVSAIVIEGVLSYSNYLTVYTPLPSSIEQTPDEGHNQVPVINAVASSLDLSSLPIPDTGKFTVSGNYSVSNVFVGQSLRVIGSALNNGQYVIASVLYNAGLDETTFGVVDLVSTNATDGQLIIDIGANVFIVDGDCTTRFTQGVQFNTVGSNYNNPHTVINSDFVDGKTRIRVIAGILDNTTGFSIKSITTGFVVTGNHIGSFPIGGTFNVVGSSHNDGSYTVTGIGSTFDGINNETTIPVIDVLDTTTDGQIVPFMQIVLVDKVYGYSEYSDVCDAVPETVVHVVFSEFLRFTSSGNLQLHDDLIVYNVENNDTWGFELPVTSILSPIEPILFEQATPPVPGVLGKLWFDTTTSCFRQFNGLSFVKISTAWWMDTNNNLLYYRTRNSFVDTGWILDLNKIPGFDEISPAVGETELLFRDDFVVGDILQDTFTLSGIVPNTDPSLIRVTINSVPAGITLNSNSEFTLLHPSWEVDDVITASVFDRTRTETNAHVHGFNVQPHIAYHEYVSFDVVNNAYIIAGGNFTNRFKPSTHFEGVQEGLGGGVLGTWTATKFPIIDVDSLLGSITIPNDLTWLFVGNRTITVDLSENNTNSFVVASSIFDGTNTIISVLSPSVTESPDNIQYFYNPGILIFNIDEVTDTIIVLGSVVDVYTPGLLLQVQNSTNGNNGIWTVASATYDTINNRTNISIIEDIPDSDSSTNASLHTPIFQNYSRDLGYILGVVYDPDVNGAYPTNQIKTIVVPTTPINNNVTGIAYEWLGPLRLDVNVNREHSIMVNMGDGVGVDNQLLSVPDRYGILDTNESENYFIIGYTDPVLNLPVDLTGRFTPRTIFDVVGSYSNNQPVNKETNDVKYVTSRTFFDNPTLRFVAIGGETKVTFDPVYSTYDLYRDSVLLVKGVDYAETGSNEICFGDPVDCLGIGTALLVGEVIAQVPSGTPISWSTGSGNTYIQIDTDYSNIPPYNSFNVVNVSNNGSSPNTIRLSGNLVTLFNNFTDPVFRLDQPLVSGNSISNIITVTDVTYDGGLIETVLTVEEEFIDELYTGALGIVEVAYSGDIFFDANNVTLPWIHGDILREVLRVDQANEILTSTFISDDLSFGWGTNKTWPIIITDNTANFELIDSDGNPGTPDVRLYRSSISIDTDITGIVEINDRVSIKGSEKNDDTYEIASMIYNVGLDDTEIVLRNDPKTYIISTSSDSSGNLDGKHFLISSATTDYYVWLDVDNGGNDPLVVGRTGIEIHVPINATADTIAFNVATTINALSDFSSDDDTNKVTIRSLSSLDPLQYARDIDTGFIVDNYTLPIIPLTQQGYLELTGIDITDWFQYLIKTLDPTIPGIVVNGNAVGDIQSGQQIRIIGTPTNDQTYTIDTPPTFDINTNTTTIPVLESISYGENDIVELPSSTTIKVLGDSYRFVQGNDTINIINSTGNDGVYNVISISQDTVYSVYTVSPSLPNNSPTGIVQFVERGGWIESLRYQGIQIFYEDALGIQIIEDSTAVVLTESGSLIGAWDYSFWDIGSFDESLGTVIHLYSNVFNP